MEISTRFSRKSSSNSRMTFEYLLKILTFLLISQQPVLKPMAVRAKPENSLPISMLINNSSNINNNTSVAASVAASQNSSINSKPSLISSTPSKNHHQPSAAQILAQNNSNNNSIQSPSTILPTAPIAFSAVAKQNPGEFFIGEGVKCA